MRACSGDAFRSTIAKGSRQAKLQLPKKCFRPPGSHNLRHVRPALGSNFVCPFSDPYAFRSLLHLAVVEVGR